MCGFSNARRLSTPSQLRCWPAAGSWLAGWCVWVVMAGPAAYGQNPFGDSPTSDNPFGASDQPAAAAQPGSPFGGLAPAAPAQPAADNPAASTTDAAAEDDPNPVVQLLRQSPPQTPQEMAQGLEWMMRFQRWDEIRRLLDDVATRNWSLEQLSQLANSGDPALWVRLSTVDAGLSDAQRALIDTILAAPGKMGQDPAWLDGWIDKLADPQPGQRRLAQVRLRDGGRAAIIRLLERLLAGDSQVAPGMLAGTVAEFGSDGIEALKAACLVSDAERAGRVFLGMAEVPGKAFSAELGAGLGSSVLSSATREALAESLQKRYASLPTAAEIAAFLAGRFRSQLDSYQQTRTSELPTANVVWRPTVDGRAVEAVAASEKDRRLEAVAQLAAHRLHLTAATTDDLVECGAVVLQRAYQVRPGLQSTADGSGLLAPIDHVVAKQASYWMRVFEQASSWQMHGGAVRAVEMLVARAPGNYLVPLDFLSELLGDSRPVVRYLALQSIAELDPQTAFAGAEQALQVAVEMSQLSPGPGALVVGANAELRLAAEQQLATQVAAEVTTAHSARAALQALDGEKPIEVIVIVDRVNDQSLFEFLQRLRSSRRGGALPIAVMTDELYKHERQLIADTPGVVQSLLSRAPQQMQQVFRQMMHRLDTQPFTPEERGHLVQVAMGYLSRIAGDRELYAHYPVSDVREDLLNLGQGWPIELRWQLLSGLGSRSSQLELVNLASRGGVSSDQRAQVADAFEQSVARFGLNLRRDDVLGVYNAYNTLGPQDPATAAALGAILDVIEQRAPR